MLHHEYDALKGYRFLGGAISFYSVSCMSDVIFNPSLLNWSSLILTVAHIYIYIIPNLSVYINIRHVFKCILYLDIPTESLRFTVYLKRDASNK